MHDIQIGKLKGAMLSTGMKFQMIQKAGSGIV